MSIARNGRRSSTSFSRAYRGILPLLVLVSGCGGLGHPSGGRFAQMAAANPTAALEAGDTCLAPADLKCAIETYYAVVVRGAHGPWLPHALYQQGRAFSMAGDLPDARLAWSK